MIRDFEWINLVIGNNFESMVREIKHTWTKEVISRNRRGASGK